MGKTTESIKDIMHKYIALFVGAFVVSFLVTLFVLTVTDAKASSWCPRVNGGVTENACVQVYAGWFHSDGTWGGGSTADLFIYNNGQNFKDCNGRSGVSPLSIGPGEIANFSSLRQISCQPGNFQFSLDNGITSTCLNGGFWHDNHYWRAYWQDPINPGQITIYLCTDRPS